MQASPLLLVILDGWGLGKNPQADAISVAKTPYFDRLWATCPHATLTTYGNAVGLPEGQMGNSEVGHLNIGAGRVVFQELTRIQLALQDGSFGQNPNLIRALKIAKNQHKPLHIMGLLSDGGVHSHIEHIIALLQIANSYAIPEIYLHAFTDGRDTAPDSGIKFLRQIENLEQQYHFKLVTVIGRYYAMDRDKRWERTQIAYDALVRGIGRVETRKFSEILPELYANHETDEFIKPMLRNGQGRIKDGDVVICANFRTDRCRQITEALIYNPVPDKMQALALDFFTMTAYDERFQNKVEVLFPPHYLTDTLGEVLAKAGKTQLRIAETEKYPHVTFFFNGGREETWAGEERLLIASPKVATYDLQPEMSAYKITEALLARLEKQPYDFVCLNFANTDMVGHTGVFRAAVQAAEHMDQCLARIAEQLPDYHLLIIADHGNADCMFNSDGSIHTAHTLNPVPVILRVACGTQEKYSLQNGKLADIAPTILQLLQLERPEVMTGHSLLTK